MGKKIVKIGNVPVGESYSVRISAEICTYFDKNINLAKEYIDFAKEMECDFLKGEVLHDLSIIHDPSMLLTYQTCDGPKTENYRDLLARKKVPLKDYEKIYRYAIDKGMPVIASVYDFKGVDFLVSIGASAAKIASQNITNRPLIEHCAKGSLSLVMDTGNALLYEIAEAVKWAEDSGVNGIILHHRPDGSPCPADRHNMRILQTLSNTFGWPVGLSCHYDGDEMIYLAIGLGANIIEKPIYHKKRRDDLDTMFALHYDNFRETIRKIRNCSDALGTSVREKLIPEQLEYRACVVAKEHIPAGTVIDLNNVVFAWPPRGIPASLWNEVRGMNAAKDLEKGKPIQWGDIKNS